MIPVGLIFTSELIGKEVLGETSKSIYNSISNISNFNETFLIKTIEELDLLKKIEIVNSLYDNSSDLKNKTIILALNNVHDISVKIENELKDIEKDIEYFKTLYFQYIRGLPYMEKINNLKKHSKILDDRLNLLIQLLSL